MPMDMLRCSVHEHKFSSRSIGEVFDRGGTNGIFKVMQLLLSEGDDYQYRVKEAEEPHQRVVKESQLSRIAWPRNIAWLPQRRDHDF